LQTGAAGAVFSYTVIDLFIYMIIELQFGVKFNTQVIVSVFSFKYTLLEIVIASFLP